MKNHFIFSSATRNHEKIPFEVAKLSVNIPEDKIDNVISDVNTVIPEGPTIPKTQNLRKS